MEDDQPISKRKKDETESGRENSRRTGANQAGKGQARPPSRKLSFVSDHNYDELLELGLCSKCGEGYHSGACGLNKDCENDEYDASIKDDEGDAKPTSENLKSAFQHHPDIADRDSYEELLKLGTEAVCGVPSHPLDFSSKVKAQRTNAKQCEADRNNGALRNLRQISTMRGHEESASTITTISITSGNASEMVNTALRNSLPGNELISETISSQNLFEDDVVVGKLSSVLNMSQINSQEMGLEYENETEQLTGFSIESPTPTVKLVLTTQSLPTADGSGVFEEIETVSTEIVNIEREESDNIIPETYLTSPPPDAEDFNSIEVEPVQSPTNVPKPEMEESMTEEAVRTPNDEATNSESQEMLPANSAEDAVSVTKVPNQPFHLKVTTDGEIQVACTKTSKNTVECTVTTQVTTKSSEMVRTSDAEIAITVIKHSTKPVTYSVPDVSTSATANNVSSNLVNQEETKPVSNIGSSSLETHEDEVLLAAVNSTSRFQVSDPIIHQSENEVVLASDSKPVTADENQEGIHGSQGPSINQSVSSHTAPEIQLDEITIEVQQEDVQETEIEIFSTSDTENVAVELSHSTPTPEGQLDEITIEEQREDVEAVEETEIEIFSTSNTENVANVEFSNNTPSTEIQLDEITIEKQQEDVKGTDIEIFSTSNTENMENVEFSNNTPSTEIQLDEITIEKQQEDVKGIEIEIFSTSNTENVANVELSHSTPTPENQLEEITVENEALNETQVAPASEIDAQIVESSHDYPQEEQLEQFFMQSGEEEESTFSIMMNMDDVPPEPVKDSLSAQGIEQDLMNNKSENLQKSKSTHQNTNRASPSHLNITEELPPTSDPQNDTRASGQLSIEKIPRNSEDILTLHEYNSEHFEPPETEMHNASTSVRTSYLLSRKTSPQANQPDVADESVSVRTSYLMSRKSSAQANPADPADESLSVRTSYLMSKRSSVQATPVPVDVADESVSVRTSYLMSKGSSEGAGSIDIFDSFFEQLDTVVEQPIQISNTNLEQDNIPSLQPITTEVFDNLAPSKTIEIRPVQHNNTPAEQSGMLEIEEHKPTLASITEDEATESHKEDLTNPNSRRTKRHKQRVKKGEGFLDLEYSLPAQETVSVVTFYETTSPSEVSEGEFENEETKEELRSRIIEQAEEIKSLISEKRMGLPQVHSDHILSLANEIISNHTKSINIFETDTQTQQQKSRKSKRHADKTDRHVQSIINIAERSKGILGKFQNTKEYKQSVPPGEATEHLSKMIKKLHCRHRKLRRLAEEIIAKRWKLMKLGSSSAPVQKSELPKTEGKGESALRKKSKPKSKAQKHLRKRARRKKIGKSKPAQMNTLKTLYTNPIARVKEVGVRSGKETWKEGDPLWKAVNKVGVEKVQKCSAHPPSTTLPPLILVGGSGSENELTEEQMNNMTRRKWNKNDGFSGLSIPGQGMSALSIFYSNLSRVTIKPSKTFVYDSKPGAPVRMGSIRLFNVDEAKLTNCFVDQWKRRSYGIGILSVILTALTHCVYMCGPRMGDNYVTYTMISRMSGHPLTAPTGIYGIIFLGYLFGGMTCIKTTAATATDSSVKDYFKKRKWKIIMWYVLAWYYFIIWVSRSISWFTGLEQTEQEIRNVFKNTFYYSQLPSRLLYTQFLFRCCGADGPDDYSIADKIGYPKSCFVGVDKYEDYFRAPKPVQYGCVVEVYKYSSYAMAVICGLTLIVWLLMIVHPIYFYVYELYICLMTPQLYPWVEEVNENTGIASGKRQE
ncbi:unnamed protein product [Orchesella dallaii]|uniref:Uncharacterized protein n=1 Tax=Orchesella dallaii TaxID=48710 RepID=A0ABP1R7R4_9HEXA